MCQLYRKLILRFAYCQSAIGSVALFFAVAAIGVTGCSNQPARVQVAAVDPDEAGNRAVELYDRDGDGQLNSEEIAAVPTFKKNLSKYDANGDGNITADEVAERIDEWFQQKIAIRTLDVVVTFDRRPLSDATVEFIPEEFLGAACKPASGVTDKSGLAKIFMDPADLPEDLKKRFVNGIMTGAYKLRVTHASKKIPARYNEATMLGEDVTKDALGPILKIELSSKS